jgi:membrane-associated phospholipid phosphatase
VNAVAESHGRLARAGGVISLRRFHARSVRSSEWLLLAYFLYAAVFSIRNSADVAEWTIRNGLIAAGVCLVFVLAWVEAHTGSLIVSCVRDWLPMALILLAYWMVDWFQPPHRLTTFDTAWIGLDRMLLRTWGGKALVECVGPVLPSVLELCYSLLYAVAPVSVAVLYLCRRRRQVDTFLSVLLLGTLTTYALLPHFPSQSPRIAFQGEDLPAYQTPFRMFNLWLLGHFDIRSSVFPSGHVTLGFSAAFAMFVAIPERRYLGVTLLFLAFAVWTATMYGRYHYAVDGLAGLAVSLAALAVTTLYSRRMRSS